MENKKEKRDIYLKNPVYLVFAVVAVLLVGVIVLNKKQSANTSSQNDTSPSLTQSPDGDVANWKTFKSQGVTFKYPSDWLSNSKVKSVYAPGNAGFTLWAYDANDPFEKNKCSEVTETENKNDLTITTYKEIIPEEGSDPCWGAGMETTRHIRVTKMGSSGNPSINFQYSSEQEFEAKNIFDQILSTLSFTNETLLD